MGVQTISNRDFSRHSMGGPQKTTQNTVSAGVIFYSQSTISIFFYILIIIYIYYIYSGHYLLIQGWSTLYNIQQCNLQRLQLLRCPCRGKRKAVPEFRTVVPKAIHQPQNLHTVASFLGVPRFWVSNASVGFNML